MSFLTAAPLRYEEFAGQKIAVFSDSLFVKGNGNAKASLRIARHLAEQRDAEGIDDAFSVLNLDALVGQLHHWREMLPQVKPFYAVKCNNDPVLLRILARLGCGFDCASRCEIEAVVKRGMSSGDNIIYANPCKTRSYIKHAEKMGVRRMTFDSTEELVKIKEMHSFPQLILRIAVADPTAQCPLSTKFGCDLKIAPKLLQAAKEMGMELIGISFHVGSGCRDPIAFRLAISASRELFEVGKAMGHRMHILDIGGGFPGHDTEEISFAEIVSVIRCSLDEHFPAAANGGIEIIAEPGRFFGSSPVSLCANVIAVSGVPASRVTERVEDGGRKGYMLYINDGVYGSFNCILFDHFQPRGRPLFDKADKGGSIEGEEEGEYPTIIWGQTCDGLDQVEAQTKMRKMRVGEWLFYANMGAYTSVAASNFNGFDTPQNFYAISESVWNAIDEKNPVENGKYKEK